MICVRTFVLVCRLAFKPAGAKAKVGPNPGVTRQVTGFHITRDPPIFVLDSPGIMARRFESTQEGMDIALKVALTGKRCQA